MNSSEFKHKKNLVISKFWSDALFPDGSDYEERVSYFQEKIWKTISENGQDNDLIIISSGAAKLWKNKMNDENISSQSAASIWQPELIKFWEEVIWLPVGQVLVNYMPSIDFSKVSKIRFKVLIQRVYEKLIKEPQDQNILSTIKEIIQTNSIPVVNFNDAVDKMELEALSHFQDNDNLFEYVVNLMNQLNFYKNIYWIVYSTRPFCINTQWELIPIPDLTINKFDIDWLLKHCDGKSNWGTWWMFNKLNVSYNLVKKGNLTSAAISNTQSSLQEVLNMLKDWAWNDNTTILKIWQY